MTICANQYRQLLAESSVGSAFLSALLRWALVILSIFFDSLKFTTYEASSIVLFVANSPIMCWLRTVLGVQEGEAHDVGARSAVRNGTEARVHLAYFPLSESGEGACGASQEAHPLVEHSARS